MMKRDSLTGSFATAIFTAVAGIIAALTVTVLWGCGGQPPGSGFGICRTGQTTACVCDDDRSGLRICNQEGTGWSSCGACGNGVPGPLGADAPPADTGPQITPMTPDGAMPPPGRDAGPAGEGPAPRQSTDKPIMIAAGHYVTYRAQLQPYGPYYVYGWASDNALSGYAKQLQTLSSITDPGVTKMIMFSSAKTLQSKLGSGAAAELKAAGVTTLGYNSEGDKTPGSEMSNLTGAVSQFATLAQGAGFDAIWGPIRGTADKTSDSAYGQMIAAGLDGIGLQEQKYIESSCADVRAKSVKALASRLKALSPSFQVNVQMMPSRCLNGDSYASSKCPAESLGGQKYAHCALFADALADAADSLAIWASSPTDNAGLVPLIKAFRHK